jgi:hypothetical protein
MAIGQNDACQVTGPFVSVSASAIAIVLVQKARELPA